MNPYTLSPLTIKIIFVFIRPRVKRDRPPLYMMEFAIIGKTKQPKEEIKATIVGLGGKLGTTISRKLIAVISNKSEVDKMNQRMEDAKRYGLQVITEDFFKMVTADDALKLIKTQSICDWGTDVSFSFVHKSVVI